MTSIDLVILACAAAGALLIRLAQPGPNPPAKVLLETGMAAASSLVVWHVALPAELAAWFQANGAHLSVAGALAFLVNGGGVNLGSNVLARFNGKKPNGNGTSPGDKAGLVLVGVGLAVAGCSTLGYQRSTLSVPRDDALIVYGEARALVQVAEVIVRRECEAKRLADDVCRVAAGLHQRALAAGALIEAARAQRDELDPKQLQALLRLGLQLAGLGGITPAGLGVLGTLVPPQ
jgi:hypothetical protein